MRRAVVNCLALLLNTSSSSTCAEISAVFIVSNISLKADIICSGDHGTLPISRNFELSDFIMTSIHCIPVLRRSVTDGIRVRPPHTFGLSRQPRSYASVSRPREGVHILEPRTYTVTLAPLFLSGARAVTQRSAQQPLTRWGRPFRGCFAERHFKTTTLDDLELLSPRAYFFALAL